MIVTADHGEAFLDYLFFLHKEVRPPLLRVPLMVRDPERPAAVVAERVALADIPPSVLERAGLAVPEGMTGRPLPTGPQESGPPRVFLSYYRFRERHFYEAYALIAAPDWSRAERIELDARTREELRALGYLV